MIALAFIYLSWRNDSKTKGRKCWPNWLIRDRDKLLDGYLRSTNRLRRRVLDRR